MTHDLELLKAAKIGYQHKLAEVEALIAAQTGSSQPQKRGRPKLSAVETPAAPIPPKKRKMSAAGRKRISDATKKRWAEFHAAKEKGKTKGAAA